MSILIFLLSFLLALTWEGGAFGQAKKEMTSDYMTIDEAAAALKLPGAAAPMAEYRPSPPSAGALCASLYFDTASQTF